MIKNIRVLLVDDHMLVLDGLQARLELEGNIDIIATASNGLDALEKAKEAQPDLVLMDVSMPILNGLEATKRFKAEQPNVKILMLSMHNDKEYILSLIQSGANGYVLKDVSSEELVQAINTVCQGGTYFSSGASDSLFSLAVSPKQSDDLTKREVAVLKALAAGLSNKEIGQSLNISVRTVETHRQNIKNKLDIHTSAGLIKYALANQLIE
ncbi:MAG: response regulator transcription factor [Gammaproteobacteria bacterium]|nr:response regulator transcription factor [Gammaproteobacteria bacterium]MBU2020717.1 response regulator transcription factor [Gammaproteobacteria bacterium]MBU2237981.1 response regulator transcription factor [Gammaproteobacteria bacterium]MBU2320387.1 response regulator transcription factor [Gammaproteobacteria bacterium]MBU2414896.1 response regulator transcription factor [Gammaproteobacteria bacterium]